MITSNIETELLGMSAHMIPCGNCHNVQDISKATISIITATERGSSLGELNTYITSGVALHGQTKFLINQIEITEFWFRLIIKKKKQYKTVSNGVAGMGRDAGQPWVPGQKGVKHECTCSGSDCSTCKLAVAARVIYRLCPSHPCYYACSGSDWSMCWFSTCSSFSCLPGELGSDITTSQ